MHARHFLRIAAALVLASSISTPAEAQLGKLGGAIKKKAKEAAGDALLGKEQEKPADAAPTKNGTPAKATATAAAKAAAAPVRVAIDSDVIDRMIKGMAAESAKRQVTVKYAACEEKTNSSQEAMNLMVSFQPQLAKVDDDKLTDEQKQDAMKRIVADMETKKVELLAKRCGAAPDDLSPVEYEAVGAEVAGLTQPQYGMLKERMAPFCTAAAKGGSVPPNSKQVYTDEEIAALRPRCAAIMASIAKLS